MLGKVLVGVALIVFVTMVMRVVVVMVIVTRCELHDHAVCHGQVVVEASRRALCHVGHGLQCNAQHQQQHAHTLRGRAHSVTSSKRVYSAWCQEISARTLRVALAPGATEKRHSSATSPSSPSR